MGDELDNKVQELLDQIPSDLDDEIKQLVNKEIDELKNTEGINQQNNLDSFYEIWLSHKDEHPGTENRINSWLAYALGLTSQKPSSDSSFLPERRAFARAGFPDVDTDFDDERRDEVYQYLIDKYGRENVGNIGTYKTEKMKSVLQNTVKAVDAAYAFHKGTEEYKSQNYALANDITRTLNTPVSGVIKTKDEEGNNITIDNLQDAYKYVDAFRRYMNEYPEVYRHAVEIEGMTSNFSCHPAGVVISDTPLQYIAPLRRGSKRTDTIATQYTMEEVESIGLIKFDVLSLSTLTLIREAASLVKENYGIDVDVENLPTDDPETLKLYRSGNLNGVFQCESGGMQQTMKDINVDRFSDVVAAIALYRPGPMDNIPDYIGRKNGDKNIDYFHKSIEPFIKPYLQDTYGVVVYQEQIMQIVNSLAGFSITDGYVMIKAIGKKKQYLLEKFQNKFLDGCESNNVSREVAQQYWEKIIVPFADYAFNRCLAGETKVLDYNSGQYWTLEELSERFQSGHDPNIKLESWKNGQFVLDDVVDVFETGEKEIFEVNLDNGMTISCTLDHKFLCDDNQFHTVREIMEEGLTILYSDQYSSKNKMYLRREYEKCKISSIYKIGTRLTYNVTMKSDQHNYKIVDSESNYSVITANSHACAYGYLSFQTAYLKANYPDEFACAFLNTFTRRSLFKSAASWDNVEMMEKDAQKLGIKILSRSLNQECTPLYKIVRKKDKAAGIHQSEIQPGVCCKGIGWETANEIAKHSPYANLEELAQRTKQSLVTETTISCLADAGFFGTKGRKEKKKLMDKFSSIRRGLKAARSQGVQPVDIFA